VQDLARQLRDQLKKVVNELEHQLREARAARDL
jgi:hypothetical protein